MSKTKEKFRLTSNKVDGRYYSIEFETLEEAFHEAALAFKSPLITYIKIKRVKGKENSDAESE